MANATSKTQIATTPWGDSKKRWPLVGSLNVTYYPNCLMGVAATGYAQKLDDTAKLAFIGINEESVRIEASSDDSSGDRYVNVDRPWLIQCYIASAAITDVGKKVYAAYDNEVQYGDGTYGNFVGRVFAYISSTEIAVAPPWSPFFSMTSAYDSVFSATADANTTLTRMDLNKLVFVPNTAAVSVVLPAVALCSPGDKITFIKTTSDLVAVTLDGNASETINGATTLVMPTGQYSTVTLVTDGAAWYTANAGEALIGSGITTESFVYGEATPLDAAFFVATRKFRVRGITVRPLVVGSDGGAVTLAVKKAPSGTAIASGTALHSSTADLKGTINTNQVLTLSTTASELEIASGDAIGIDCTGTMTAARGVVTVTLEPVA